MKRKLRYVFLIIGILFILLIGALWYANYAVKQKLVSLLETRLPAHITPQYEEIKTNIWEGTVRIKDPIVKINNRGDTTTHTTIRAEHISIKDVSYWDYLFNKDVTIEDIKLVKPRIKYHPYLIVPAQEAKKQPLLKINKTLIVEALSINNAQLTIYENAEKIKLRAPNVTIQLDDILVNSSTLSQKIPLQYSSYEAQGDSVFVGIGPYEHLHIGSFDIMNSKATFDSITLKTKFSKKRLSQVISIERDHYNFHAKNLEIDGLDFGFRKDQLYVASSNIILSDPYLNLFRDKLVTDDPTPKNLYSKMLRDLKVELKVDSLKVQSGTLIYSEKAHTENDGGTIEFSELNAAMTNVSNTYQSPTKTNIDIDAIFMKSTPIQVMWSFDVNDPSDSFLFQGEIGQLAASDMNPFTEPNLNISLSGITNKTYFTVGGNAQQSTIDMKMNYEDFKVAIHRKKGFAVNKVLSKIANLFIKKNSDSASAHFREGSANVERDKTKSFFHYLWINIKKALFKTLS